MLQKDKENYAADVCACNPVYTQVCIFINGGQNAASLGHSVVLEKEELEYGYCKYRLYFWKRA